MTIQQQIQSCTSMFPPGYPMHITDLCKLSHSRYGLDMPYSYKQIRDALYRLRVNGVLLAHTGQGWYRWDVL